MTDQVYNRSEHEASCPCNFCTAYDILYAVQEKAIDLKQFKPGGLQELLIMYRNRKLNWDLPVHHCLLCGGTSFATSTVQDHHLYPRYNEKQIGGRWLSSLLVHRQSAMIGAYNTIRVREPQYVPTWAAQLMDLQPEKCVGIAIRDLPDWLELRLAFTELVADSYADRIERIRNKTSREVGSIGSSP